MLRRGDFVVMLFRFQPQFRHNGEHFRSHVLARVYRWYREIPPFRAWAVAKIAIVIGGARIIGAFAGVDDEPGIVLLG